MLGKVVRQLTDSWMYWRRKGEARRLSTGQSKKPWISFWCRSMVMRWFNPERHIIFATSLDTMHPRLRILPASEDCEWGGKEFKKEIFYVKLNSEWNRTRTTRVNRMKQTKWTEIHSGSMWTTEVSTCKEMATWVLISHANLRELLKMWTRLNVEGPFHITRGN